MSNPLSYATLEFYERSSSIAPAGEITYRIIKAFLEDCISEGRGTSESEFVYVLNDLDKQHEKGS